MDAPKLEVLNGPLKRATFALHTGGDVSVGREEDNLIRIAHSSVSRHHCVFGLQHGSVFVRDLGSRNGTLVNGVAITGEHLLSPGDEIHVGNSIFALNRDSRGGPLAEPHLAIDASGSRFLTPNTADTVPVTAQVIRLLDGLLKASLGLSNAASFNDWEAIIFESVFALTKTERAAILPPETSLELPTEAEGVTRASFKDNPKARAAFSLEVSIGRQALVRNQTLAGRNARESVLASPIRVISKTGLLYLEAQSFSEDDLHSIAAITTLAGLAWERVFTITQLESENERLWNTIDHDLIGGSSSIESLIDFIRKVAPAPSNILLLGESGTGKDLVARAIHRNSPRAAKPFLSVNCGAIPASLIESELFGSERGAFTGASMARKGLFEAAAGGTIFLDEISELPLAMQPALLQVLQNREIRRLGAARPIALDFRLIAASNRDLEEMVEQGLFRPDLYHRLRVVSRSMPPLRERPEDIPRLAAHFVRKFAQRSRPECRGLSKAALRSLSLYSWPGNVRELENSIERAVVMGTSTQVELEDLPETIAEHSAGLAQSGGFHEDVVSTKRKLVLNAICQSTSLVEAARLLKVHPNYLHRLVNNLGLRQAMVSMSEATGRESAAAASAGASKASL